MSSIAMAADSTQADLLRRDRRRTSRDLSESCHRGKLQADKSTHRKSRKESSSNSSSSDSSSSDDSEYRSDKSKRLSSKPGKQKRRYNHKDESCSDRDSDLELSKELLSIGGYITSSEKMVDQMFRSISTKKLRAMLPEILKTIDLNELKQLCILQLEGMSRKRVTRILDGDDPDDISSTESEEEKGTADNQDTSTILQPVGQSQTDPSRADSIVDSATSLQVVGGVSGSIVNVGVVGHLVESAKASSLSASAQQPLIDENLHSIENDDGSDSVSDTCSVHSHNSLPSLASEPEDTCTPFRFLQRSDAFPSSRQKKAEEVVSDRNVASCSHQDDGTSPSIELKQKKVISNCDTAAVIQGSDRAPAQQAVNVQRLQTSLDPNIFMNSILAGAENDNNLNMEAEISGTVETSADPQRRVGNGNLSLSNTQETVRVVQQQQQQTLHKTETRNRGTHEMESNVAAAAGGTREQLASGDRRGGSSGVEIVTVSEQFVLADSCCGGDDEVIFDLHEHDFSEDEPTDTDADSRGSSRRNAVSVPDQKYQRSTKSRQFGEAVLDSARQNKSRSTDVEAIDDRKRSKSRSTDGGYERHRIKSNNPAHKIRPHTDRRPSPESGHQKRASNSSNGSRRLASDTSDNVVVAVVANKVPPRRSNLSDIDDSDMKTSTDPAAAVHFNKRPQSLPQDIPLDRREKVSSKPKSSSDANERERDKSPAKLTSSVSSSQLDPKLTAEAVSKTRLEILELEMRARAIRAMLKAQEDNEKDSKPKQQQQQQQQSVGHEYSKRDETTRGARPTAGGPRLFSAAASSRGFSDYRPSYSAAGRRRIVTHKITTRTESAARPQLQRQLVLYDRLARFSSKEPVIPHGNARIKLQNADKSFTKNVSPRTSSSRPRQIVRVRSDSSGRSAFGVNSSSSSSRKRHFSSGSNSTSAANTGSRELSQQVVVAESGRYTSNVRKVFLASKERVVRVSSASRRTVTVSSQQANTEVEHSHRKSIGTKVVPSVTNTNILSRKKPVEQSGIVRD